MGLACVDSDYFTGKQRDTEFGNDYFGARYYGSRMGRFMSPDWSSRPEGVPDAQLDNPQSLNLYGYVGNDPGPNSERIPYLREILRSHLINRGSASGSDLRPALAAGLTHATAAYPCL